MTFTIQSANGDSDPHAQGTAPSTNAHYRRVKRLCSSAVPPAPHYERCGYKTGFTEDAQGMFSFAFIGAPENGDFGDFYGVSNICMTEYQTEEFVLQFLREKPDSYVNVAVTFVKGLSENYDGSVMFDGGQDARGSARGIPHQATAEDERFEIGMTIDFTWGYDNLRTPPKLVKCKGLSFDMPGFDMEIVGNYDPSTNQLWDDKSRDFFNQTFNFRMDEGTQECYIRFARNAERARGLELGDHTIVTRDFQLRPDNGNGCNGISLDFTVRHRSRAELAQMGTSSQRLEPSTIANKSLRNSNPPHLRAAASEDPAKQHPQHKKEIQFFDHPEHKLVLQEYYYKKYPGSWCSTCGGLVDKTKWVYVCPHDACDYGVHASCGEHPQHKKEIRFFDHPEHKLVLREYYYKKYPGSWCSACEGLVDKTKWVYVCPHDACDYGVHASCGDIPRTFQHPSHSKHALKLVKLEHGAYKMCDVCKESLTRGLHYHCAMCDFDAHLVCTLDMVEEGEASVSSGLKVVKGDASEEGDASEHRGRDPVEDLAYQTIEIQKMAFQLEQSRQLANMMASFGHSMANF